MSIEEKLDTPPETPQGIGLDSPAKIIPSLTNPAHQEPKDLPALPPREITAQLPTDETSSEPPVLPPRENTALPVDSTLDNSAEDDAPELPPRSPTSQNRKASVHHNTDHMKSQRKHEQLNKSLLNNDTGLFMIKHHASFMVHYKTFLGDQGLLKQDVSEDISKKLDELDSSIDVEFWKFFLLNYDQVGSILDYDVFQKTEVEFNNLDILELRHLAYLVLTHSTIIDDELFNSLEVDVSSEQELFLQELKKEVSDDLLVVLSKLITVNSEIPNQFVIETAKLALRIPGFEPSDVFKLLVSFDYQFKKLVPISQDESNSVFIFQFARALEDNCAQFLLLLTKIVGKDQVLKTLSQLLSDSIFWKTYFSHFQEDLKLVKLFDSFVLKGFEIAIIIMTKLIKSQEKFLIGLLIDEGYDAFFKYLTLSTKFLESLNDPEFYNKKEPIHLYKYKEEYKIIVNHRNDVLFPKKSDERIKKAGTNFEMLTDLKKQLEFKYNQILSNYQQLNEEKFTNETYFKPLAAKKIELTNESRLLRNEYDMKTQNLEILKINNARNEEVDRSNEQLTEQIAKMNEEVEVLKEKIAQLKLNKLKR